MHLMSIQIAVAPIMKAHMTMFQSVAESQILQPPLACVLAVEQIVQVGSGNSWPLPLDNASGIVQLF